MGLSTFRVRVGDIVCIAYGCRVPVILRRASTSAINVQEKEKYYTFVGPAYIHGLWMERS
jgi:hypothetical protein